MVALLQKLTSSINVLPRQRVTKSPEQQHAGLIVFVGRLMALCFTFTVMAFIFGILFIVVGIICIAMNNGTSKELEYFTII